MEISVVIPTCNRASLLAKTLRQLGSCAGAEALKWETIVVDNNSKDDTRGVTESLASASGNNIRYIFEPSQGASYARNRGIRESAAGIVIFIDDDMVIPPGWLIEMHRTFERYGACCVGGPVLFDPQQELPSWWDERFLAPLSVFNPGAEPIVSNRGLRKKEMLATGGNCGFLRTALERNGGFRTDIGRFGEHLGGGEDSELVLRLQRNGETVVYNPSALLYHSPDTARFTRKFLPRFYYNYGVTRCQMDMLFPEPGARVAGVARWKYRWLLLDSAKAVWGMLTGNAREALYHRTSLNYNWGYAAAIVRTKRRVLLSATPEPIPQRLQGELPV